MKLTKEALAAQLNGREHGEEITREEAAAARESGLVVVFGYSDDNIEFRGMFYEEFGCYGGGSFPLHRGGVLTDPSCGECEHCEERARKESSRCADIRALWNKDGYSWIFETAIPHATFEVVEGDEKFCRGIVFSVNDLPDLH